MGKISEKFNNKQSQNNFKYYITDLKKKTVNSIQE